MSTHKRVRDLLLAAKAASDLSDRQIAERGEIGHATVSNYLNGILPARPLSDDMLDRLARGFGIKVSTLRAADLADRGLAPAEAVGEEEVPDIIDAIMRNPSLLPEAKEHLIRQVGLLLRVQAAPTAEEAAETFRASRKAKLAAQPANKAAPRRPQKRQ